MLNKIEILEAKIRPLATVKLMPLLIQMDKQIEAERVIARITGDFKQLGAMCDTRFAIINIMDERKPELFQNYCSAKYEVAA